MEQLIKSRANHSWPRLARQRGIVIYIVLVVLVVMSLGALGLMRSVDTGTLISGNISFKQASLHLADIGTEAAINELARFTTTSADAAYPANCTASGSCRYYPTMQTVTPTGVPTTINWANVAKSTDVTYPSTFNGNNVISGGYSVQFVVERLCTGSLPITDPALNCYAIKEQDEGGSKKVGSVVFSSVSQLYYRVTIRVSDARGAETLTQVVLRR